MPHLVHRRRAGLAAALLSAGSVLMASALLAAPTPAAAADPLIRKGDIIVPSFGNLFDSPIDRLDPNTGERTRIANNGKLDRPRMATSDASANLFIANNDSSIVRIDHITGAQSYITLPGSSLVIRGLAMSPAGKLLVASAKSVGMDLFEIDPNTKLSSLITSDGLLGALITDIAVEHDGSILVVDKGNRQVVRVNPVTHTQKQLATFATGNVLGSVIARDDGSILVRTNLPTGTPAIVKIDRLTGLKSVLTSNGNLSISKGMARNAEGFIFVGEQRRDADSTVTVLDGLEGNVQTTLDRAGFGDTQDITIAGVSQIPPTPNPIARADTFTLEQPIGQFQNAVSVLANDTDPAGGLITAERITDVQHGFTSFFADGFFFYFPDTGFTGDDKLTYRTRSGTRVSAPTTVTFHVLPPQAPIAKDDFLNTPFGKELVMDADLGPLINDSDPQGDPFTPRIVSQPSHGLASFGTDDSFNYLPAANFSGDDSLTYQLTDGKHKSNIATIHIKVGPPPAANTAPKITLAKGGSIDAAGTSATANLTISDTETSATALIVSATSSAQTIVPSSGIKLGGTANARTITITPAASALGTATVTVKVTDANGLSKTLPITVKVDDGGSHTLLGTTGVDMLFGRGGTDTLKGDAANDFLSGGDGNDTLTGGSGADLMRGGIGTNTVTDFNAADGDSATEATT